MLSEIFFKSHIFFNVNTVYLDKLMTMTINKKNTEAFPKTCDFKENVR